MLNYANMLAVYASPNLLLLAVVLMVFYSGLAVESVITILPLPLLPFFILLWIISAYIS